MSSTKRERLSAEERKARTLERVTEVFATKGFSGTTTASLAEAAGISEGMLYKLFGSKRGLYQAMIERKVADDGWGTFPTDPAGPVSEREFFTGMARAIFAKVEADPNFARLLLFSDLQGSEFAQLFHEAMGGSVIEAVAAYLRGGIERGALREVDPELAATGFLLMTWQYAVCTKVLAYERLPHHPDEHVIQTFVSLFLDGLVDPTFSGGTA